MPEEIPSSFPAEIAAHFFGLKQKQTTRRGVQVFDRHCNLTGIDWLIILVYFAFVLGIGFTVKRYVRTSNDFFLAGRSIPAWVCGLAFISADLACGSISAQV